MSFGSDSLEILLYIFFETPDWEAELRERNRMALDIMRLADYLGVRFSIPSQAIQLEQASQEAGETASGRAGSPSERDETDAPQEHPSGVSGSAVGESAQAQASEGTAGGSLGEESERVGRAAAAAITADAPWRARN